VKSSLRHDREPASRFDLHRRQGRRLPAVSIVVVSSRSQSTLSGCLSSLSPQCLRFGAELIVARAADAADLDALRRAYPAMRIVKVPVGATIAQLRAAGMNMAMGDIIAVTEDNAIADSDWVETLSSGMRRAPGADFADRTGRRKSTDWAGYFARQGAAPRHRRDPSTYAPPGNERPAAVSAADAVVAWARAGEVDGAESPPPLYERTARRFAGTASDYETASGDFWRFCRNRFDHGFDYARVRCSEDPAVFRWRCLLACALLPMRLTAEIARATVRTSRTSIIRVLPATFMFVSAWSIGEALGYLRGPGQR
jgi:hypothetical protein